MTQKTVATPAAGHAAEQRASEPSTLLDVRHLTTVFRINRRQEVFAVNDVSFRLEGGKVLGLVGESGCGKTTCGLSILRLIRAPGYIKSGQIFFHGEDLTCCSQRRLRRLRGEKLAMVFQNPMNALNPVERVGAQISEMLRTHGNRSKRQRDERVEELLNLVGIPDPRRCKESYPHELSGGMRQRVLIAIALALNPEFLVADEPTTAVDVTIQAQILWLLQDLQSRMGMGVLYITHDLLVAASMSHEIAVMYGGFIVEQAPTAEFFRMPVHPYTIALMNALPQAHWRNNMVSPIPGQPPITMGEPATCPFAPRCPSAVEVCFEQVPVMEEIAPEHTVRCFRWQESAAQGGRGVRGG